MNVEWVSRLPAPVRATAYFAAQRLIGSRIRGAERDVQAWTQFAPAELGRAVEERLSVLLSSALKQSAYYRRLGLRKPPSVSAVETNLLSVYFIGNSFTDPVRSGELAKLAATSTPTA